MIIEESVGLHKERCRHWQRKNADNAFAYDGLHKNLLTKIFIRVHLQKIC